MAFPWNNSQLASSQPSKYKEMEKSPVFQAFVVTSLVGKEWNDCWILRGWCGDQEVFSDMQTLLCSHPGLSTRRYNKRKNSLITISLMPPLIESCFFTETLCRTSLLLTQGPNPYHILERMGGKKYWGVKPLKEVNSLSNPPASFS